ncbi:hypothetical protein AOLI_G00097790 [Acnodon oligacanthus]
MHWATGGFIIIMWPLSQSVFIFTDFTPKAQALARCVACHMSGTNRSSVPLAVWLQVLPSLSQISQQAACPIMACVTGCHTVVMANPQISSVITSSYACSGDPFTALTAGMPVKCC